MLHKAWNSKGEMPYCFPRSSIKFQGHTVQNITDFDPNGAFSDYRPVAAFKSLRFALLILGFLGKCNRPTPQIQQGSIPYIPQYTIHKKCTHFCSEWCIVGFGIGTLWDMWDCSISMSFFNPRSGGTVINLGIFSVGIINSYPVYNYYFHVYQFTLMFDPRRIIFFYWFQSDRLVVNERNPNLKFFNTFMTLVKIIRRLPCSKEMWRNRVQTDRWSE